ncbi:SusC/RagA family TonB-linked outer membrane protein [candidate division KSB1 bacterium]
MSKFTSLLFVFCLFLLSSTAFAQTGAVIRGAVNDENGDPMQGANVCVKGTEIGALSDFSAATDSEGNYEFIVPARYVNGQIIKLFCTNNNYKQQEAEITLRAGAITQYFAMEPDVLNLDDVIVTGVIGKTPRKKLTFTVEKVNKAQLYLAPAANMASAMAGKVSSVTVRNTSGAPGSGISVMLRGATSLTRGNEPLVIVDGVILGEGLQDLDALDIDSIEMIKGAAASSLYGSRAANGVIRITTKRGNDLAENSTRITFRNEYGFSALPDYDNPLSMHHEFKTAAVNGALQWADTAGNALGFEGDANEALTMILGADEIWKNYWAARGGKLRGGFERGTDWFEYSDGTESGSIAFQDNEYFTELHNPIDEFFDPGSFYFNSLSIAQNLGKTNWRVSFSNHRNSGIVRDAEGYYRRNARFNLDHQAREGLHFDMSGYYMVSRVRVMTGGLFGLMFMAPDADLNEPNYDGTAYHINADRGSREDNPLYGIYNQEDYDDRQRIMGSFNVRYNPCSWFGMEGSFSYDRSDKNNFDYTPIGYKSFDNPDPGGSGYYAMSNAVDYAINSGITGNITYSFNDLRTRWRFGYLYETSRYDSFNARGGTLTVNDLRDLDNVSGTKSASSASERVVSNCFLFITGWDYKDRYIADFLLRRDGSSLFGPYARWNDFFRASAAWRLSEESWFNFGENINEFKLRYSIGTAGNRPSFQSQYEYIVIFSGASSGPGNLGNKKLKPETSTEQEIGLEVSLFERLGLELTYAAAETKGQILAVPLPRCSGWGSQYQNTGTMENYTWEGSINCRVYSSRDFSWHTRLVMDRTRQRITKLRRPAYRTGPENAYYICEDEEYGTMYGVQWAGSISELSEAAQANAGLFQVNDLGHIVYVGDSDWTEGITGDLWGTSGIITDGTNEETYQWGMPIKRLDENGKSFYRLGRATPDFSWAFSNDLRWKGVQFYALFDASIGGMIYNETRQWAQRENRHNVSDAYGIPDTHKKPFLYWQTLYDKNSTGGFFAEPASYVKLREITIRYNFRRDQLVDALGNTFGGWLNRVSVGAVGRNLITWTDYSGFDPEVAGGTVFAVDDFRYPNNRQVTAFIEIEF